MRRVIVILELSYPKHGFPYKSSFGLEIMNTSGAEKKVVAISKKYLSDLSFMSLTKNKQAMKKTGAETALSVWTCNESLESTL